VKKKDLFKDTDLPYLCTDKFLVLVLAYLLEEEEKVVIRYVTEVRNTHSLFYIGLMLTFQELSCFHSILQVQDTFYYE